MDYSFLYIEDLYILDIDKKYYLLDTACPQSFSLNDLITINNKKYETKQAGLLKDRLEKISKKLDKKLNGIIGFDIIKKTGLYIDKDNKKISFEAKKIDGTSFDFKVFKYNQYEYIRLEFDTFGLTPYGMHSFILDSGIAKTLLKVALCDHSQYAYRKDLYYLSVDKTYPADFVFESFYQGNKHIDAEVGMNNDSLFLKQLKDVDAGGVIALNDVFKEQIVIDIENNKIIVK